MPRASNRRGTERAARAACALLVRAEERPAWQPACRRSASQRDDQRSARDFSGAKGRCCRSAAASGLGSNGFRRGVLTYRRRRLRPPDRLAARRRGVRSMGGERLHRCRACVRAGPRAARLPERSQGRGPRPADGGALRAKHGISCAVLPTSAEPWELAPPRERPQEDDREILFAGAIYWAQEDALRRLGQVGARARRRTPDGGRVADRRRSSPGARHPRRSSRARSTA